MSSDDLPSPSQFRLLSHNTRLLSINTCFHNRLALSLFST